ncbi:PilN domain-containing protein [Heliophilum fasciatum]|uniref:Type IV pilus assembly protein PilN n=1 Tax=Heliophilum fasciatum TaxID=35700 RepID=A0A4R2S7B2_9FIRM|nr:PilN domain-containing protein [Heliophilum fasciatum]MCW2277288.1 type IV pilus assembly protein PilN [Heliophilum fasciatum]TCP67125.1 type IV pilus assembly protein PilN [Heliophilum fasciatum]
MESINLLPVELQPQKADRRTLLMRWASVGILLLLGIAYVIFVVQLFWWQWEVQQMEAEMDTLRPQVEQVELLERQIAVDQNKTTTLEQLHQTRLSWAEVFREIKNSTPDGVWLMTVAVNPETTKNVVEIEGQTTIFEQVGVLALRLKELPYFTDTVIVEAKDQVVNGQVVTRFLIRCSVKPDPEVLMDSKGQEKKLSGANGEGAQ